MKAKIKINRVDFQVSILAITIVILSFVCVYSFNYYVTYNDMIHSLTERVTRIYNYVEDKLDKSTFKEINSIEDESLQSYQDMKLLLENIKGATGVRYLYTAKRIEDGSYIYIIDGLDSSSSDFRNAGDIIEEEIQNDMNRALNDEIILPSNIKETTWGHIFISYFPIHDNGEVVGVLGIEFDAEHQYKTFQTIQIVTPIIAILTCLIAVLLALKIFKRISNPAFKDIANTDYLTRLKNRNAFEVDMNNLNQSKVSLNVGIIAIDLNGLKTINDTLGHRVGDFYIQSAGKVLEHAVPQSQLIYRVGGDEYVVLVINANTKLMESIIEEINHSIEYENKNENLQLSMAIGFAIYDDQLEHDLFDTYKRADRCMYQNKQVFKDLL